MYFSEIIGHKDIVKNLINVISKGQISHAYLFEGREGVGRFRTAKTFAQGILCEDFQGDCCGKCKPCRLTFHDTHPDLIVKDFTIGEDGKERASISVDAIRQFKKEVYLKPFFANRKIYILEQGEKMTTEAQNALLKIFEDPPHYVTIIILCNGLSKLLPTVQSRGVIVKFSELQPKELEIYLKKAYNEISEKELYASISGGSIAKMLQWIQDEEGLTYRKKVLEGAAELLESPRSVSINPLLFVFTKYKDRRHQSVELIQQFLMDLARLKTGNTHLLVNRDLEPRLRALAPQVRVEELYRAETILITFSEQLAKNANYKLAVLNMLIQIREGIHG